MKQLTFTESELFNFIHDNYRGYYNELEIQKSPFGKHLILWGDKIVNNIPYQQILLDILLPSYAVQDNDGNILFIHESKKEKALCQDHVG